MTPQTAEDSVAANGPARWVWLVGVLACVAFAASAATYPFMVRSGAHDLGARFQSLLTSADYSFGPHSTEAQHPLYLRALAAFSLHTIAGSAALLAATTQFMPFVRRRWPMIHRLAGAFTVVLVAGSMVGAMLVQASHPLSATLSGTGFGIGLMSLAGLTLTELVLAVLAVLAADYRSHMGWMALMYASLLTAPVLRVQWLLLGLTSLRMDEVNLIVAMFVIPQTIFMMACWMMTVGADDLGVRLPKAILPSAVSRCLAILTAIVAIHEGCLAPFGFDLVPAWRGAGPPLPASAGVWGLATAALAWRMPTDLARIDTGDAVRPATIVCAVLAAAGALAVACTFHGVGREVMTQRSFFAGWGLEIALLVFLGRNAVLGHGASWDAQWLFLALALALWPVLARTYIALGIEGSIATATAMAIAYSTLAVFGFASGFGLKVVVSRRDTARVVPNAAEA